MALTFLPAALLRFQKGGGVLPKNPQDPTSQAEKLQCASRPHPPGARGHNFATSGSELPARSAPARPASAAPGLRGLQPRRPPDSANTYPAGCRSHRLHRGLSQLPAVLGAPQRPRIACRLQAPGRARSRCPARRMELAGRVPQAGGRAPMNPSRPPASRVSGTRGPTAACGAPTADARLTALGAAAASGRPGASGQ